MSLGNDLARSAFHKAANAEQKSFKNGMMPLLGSRRIVKIKTIYAHDMMQRVLYLIPLLLLWCPYFMMTNKWNEVEMNETVKSILNLIGVIYVIAVTLIYFFDLDTAECYLLGYKKSNYYLATREAKRDIPRSEGLIGEYKGYVLSRSLSVPHKTLHNVCVPMRNGNFQEVDTIIITPNIMYVVECKNRGGEFVGEYDEPKWMQYIGSQAHESKNMYMQNQGHTMAIDQFLLDRGIIQNGQNVCMNVIFTTGDMKLPTKHQPLDFIWGNTNKVRRYIEANEKRFNDGTDTTGIMNEIYEALLPYALYTNDERASMMKIREIRSESKEFALGGFYTEYLAQGVSGVTKPGEAAEIRSNKVYTQVRISEGTKSCWQTRTDLGVQAPMNPNQIATGVSKERVEAYKKMTQQPERKLVVKMVVWIVAIIGGIVTYWNAGLLDSFFR